MENLMYDNKRMSRQMDNVIYDNKRMSRRIEIMDNNFAKLQKTESHSQDIKYDWHAAEGEFVLYMCILFNFRMIVITTMFCDCVL